MKAGVRGGKPAPEAVPSARKPGRRESGKLQKAARIKMAARDLFHEVGFEATTIQAVAERAGIGKGTLFSYASVKEDLLIIVFIDELMEVAVAAKRRAMRSRDLVDSLYQLYGGMLEYHYQTTSLSRHLVRVIAYIESPEMRENIAPLVLFNRDAAVSFIAQEQSRGAFKAVADAGLVADNCFAIYYNVLSQMLMEWVPIEEARKLLRARLAVQLTPYQI